MALQATSVSLYDRVKAAAARSKATTNFNRVRYHLDLVTCHLCPEVGTLSVIQKHIRTQHKKCQSKHNVNDDLKRSPSSRQQQQPSPRAIGLAEPARPNDQEIATCAAPIDMAKISPVQQIVTTEQSLEQNVNDASGGNPEAATQTLGQLNFSPINPDYQPQEVEDVNTDNVVDLIQNEVPREISGKINYKVEPPNPKHIQNKPETTPDSVEVEAAPTMAAPATREQSTAQEIMVLEVEDIPVETVDDKFRVICLTYGEVVTKFHYASHKANDCYSLARPPEVRSTENKQFDISTGFPETSTDRIAAVYRDALRKPNFNGTYNVNGKVGLLEDLKIYIWNLASKARPGIEQ